MTRFSQVAATLAVTGAMTFAAYAQEPAPPLPGVRQAQRPGQNNANTPAAVAAGHEQARRRSIVHHYPYPYPEYYHGDQTAGFRNPGGTGRYLEYYPPGNQFQERGDPVRVATFDQGFGNRSEQLQSLQVGVQRENAIMNHIDNYARPAFGYGFGAGYFGGLY